MLSDSAPEKPRHSQIFNLLRQSHQSDMTVTRLSGEPGEQPAQWDAEVWRKEAIESLYCDPNLKPVL